MRNYDQGSSTGEYWSQRREDQAEAANTPMSLDAMETQRDLAKQRSYELKEEYRGELLAEAAEWDRRIEEAKAKGRVV